MQRRLTPEHMDHPDATREELAAALDFIRSVNRRLGGVRATLRPLQRWAERWPKDAPIRILDIGTGAADIPHAIVQWARANDRRVHVTAIDFHPTTLDLARELVGDDPDITLLQADALQLTDRFQPGDFDYAHAAMFLHHLPEIEVMTVLRVMDRLASRGVIWNDLIRSRLAWLGIRLLTLGRPAPVRHDARVSVDAGFTRAEVLDLARRVGLDYTRYHAGMLTQRFILAGEKTTAGFPPAVARGS
ncbi:MAG: methyltransferase domain-containing protein [Phycisphaerales bacterium]